MAKRTEDRCVDFKSNISHSKSLVKNCAWISLYKMAVWTGFKAGVGKRRHEILNLKKKTLQWMFYPVIPPRAHWGSKRAAMLGCSPLAASRWFVSSLCGAAVLLGSTYSPKSPLGTLLGTGENLLFSVNTRPLWRMSWREAVMEWQLPGLTPPVQCFLQQVIQRLRRLLVSSIKIWRK